MKKRFHILLFSCVLIVLGSCSNDELVVTPVNESELITTVRVTLSPVTSGTDIVLTFRDLDGAGSGEPTITVSEDLTANFGYNGTIEFLDETKAPAEDITQEVEAESAEHQVFFLPGQGLNLTFQNLNVDSNNNPLGTQFFLQTGAAGTGELTIVLLHEPKKPNDGTLADAGGETDVQVSFPVTVN